MLNKPGPKTPEATPTKSKEFLKPKCSVGLNLHMIIKTAHHLRCGVFKPCLVLDLIDSWSSYTNNLTLPRNANLKPMVVNI